ncbi:NAD-dependent epimerase/dehydratase family protein [Olivibacter jilunii]|uniref:NAD-dependent epimerase/dehydratase family protein n=1 Tax=Olivibacter jilunii TaxID=985016 RepID=UPI003F1549FA
MNRIIITGASGFVGTNLLSFLSDRGWTDNHKLSLRGEIPKVLAEAQAIIHLAGKAHDLKKASNGNEYFRINTDLTKELFDTFLRSKISDFIYFSSVKAVADAVDGVLREDVTPKPGTPYGESKLKAEQYLLSRELPEGKRLFIFRPCMIHGPNNKGNLNLLYKVVKKGIPYPLGAFENKRSFLSIDNLLVVIERVLRDTAIPGGVYNLADDGALSTNEVIEIIAKADGRKPRIWSLSPNLIGAFAKLGDIFHLPLNTERLKKLTESYVVSNEKIKEALNIDNLPVSIRAGLFETIQSFQ